MGGDDIEARTGLPGAIFRRRRERVLRELGSGAMLLPAAPIRYRAGDSEVRYRPDSELYYLTGFTEPGAVLLLRGYADRDRSLLFVRPRDEVAELWSGPRLGPEGALELVGVDDARPVGGLRAALPELLEGADRVHFRLGVHPELEGGVVQALREARLRGTKTGTGPRAVVDPGEILDEMRLRKDPREIELLRDAARVSIQGFRAALARVGPGVGEWEVEAEMEAGFRRHGAMGPSFATIVGSGANTCVLHYIDNGRRMEGGELVLIDAGAEVRMYSGDITRTVPVSGRFTPEQRAIYEVVDSARREAIEAVAPGVRTSEIHERSTAAITRGLRELGLLEGSMGSLIEAKAWERWFPHRTSHWLGLNTHDVGDYARKGQPRPLEEGMVLTIEPGLYFPPGDEHRFRGIGIRIEDDVLVTEGGAEVLTAALPTSAEEVEALVREGADVDR